MKKIFSRLLLAFIGVVTFATTASAQMTDPLPLDPAVRKGTLPNGLTYYVRHNETPKGQADFYIAQKVGSILEDDNQRGLAHFLEHMCFNGTENFPGNQIVSWLETKGVKFGRDLNAYTSIDETVYNINNVPVANEAVQDSCLLILHDWADGLLLLPEEIDKERGVIHEEWRMRNVGQQRLMEQLAPTVYPGSKYGYRLPIGTMEVVDNFKPQALRDYYEAWYRPDQQGIIVVGDIDVDRIENKIKEMFSPIKMPADAKERVYEAVPDNAETIYAIGADPEMDNARAMIFFKSDVIPVEMRNSMVYEIQQAVTSLATMMLNNRLDEITASPDAPMAAAGSFYGNFYLSKTKDALTGVVIGKDGDILNGLKSVYREILRAKRGGFTISEYDRAREELLSRLEKQYNNREKTENNTYVQEYVRNFIDNEPAPGIEFEYQTAKMILPQLPVDAINQAFKELVTDSNRVVMVMMPEKEGFTVPTVDQVKQAMAEVDAEDIAAFVDEVKAEPLIANLPAPGKVVSTRELPEWGAVEWTLSNGAKVVAKHTDFKADEIVMDAQALGGTSIYPDSYNETLVALPMMLQQYGLGTYTYKDLQKYLQGKQCGVSMSFDTYVRDISGNSTPKDLKTMMELLYSNFTQFNLSADELQATKNTMIGVLHNQETNPQYIFGADLSKALYSNSRNYVVCTASIEAAKLDQITKIVKDATANAADYTFYFVGNFDPAQLQTLCEQYIATLPGDAAKAQTKLPEFNPALGLQKGDKLTKFTAPMQTPQTFAAVVEFAKMPYTAKNALLASIAGQILTQRLLTTVREDMGAVYSISAQGRMSRTSIENAVMQSAFPMKPEMQDQVLEVIAKEFANMESNVKTEELNKVVEYMVKDATENLEKNNSWINGMSGAAINGVDTFNGKVDLLKTLTVADVQNYVKELNAQGNYRVILLNPEETPAK